MSKKLIKAGNAIVEQVSVYAEVDAQLRDAINEWVKLVKSPTKPSGRKPTPEAVPLAEYLIQRITESCGGNLLSSVHASAPWMAKLLRAGKTPQQIRDTIDWKFDVNDHDPYPLEVESGRSFYQKWDKMQVKMSKQKPVQAKGGYY